MAVQTQSQQAQEQPHKKLGQLPRLHSGHQLSASERATGSEDMDLMSETRTPPTQDHPPRTEESFRLTPKGWLYARTTIASLEPETLWRDLIKFVAKQADSNGCTDGIPCLVMEGAGHCIRVKRVKESEADSVPNANAAGEATN